ncbi:MAG TPA: N-acetylmuramoyl-L-alanine amidase-like domain-containing protein [Bacteroidota bacterium]|nr:N-acetylmuramoyl-L-alanine amidase-like domain-containing protein [Bacteroidota bacterium]
MNRRRFIEQSLSSALAVFITPQVLTSLFENEDVEICKRTFDRAVSRSLFQRPIGEVVVEIGKSFLGTDYLAHALEVPGEERLVVNLRGLDCVSLCENALVFARCVKLGKTSFEDYKAQLQFIRYRGGIIDQYPSRLHYFSDWIFDNGKKGVLRNMTREFGGERYLKPVNFMSTHPQAYRQLRERPEFVEMIKQQEKEISQREMFHISKNRIKEIEKNIDGGDMLAITTSIEGLDVSHTGIAVWKEERLHMLHAPDVGFKVTITDLPLAEYLQTFKRQMGIIVARPLEPRM